MKNMFKAFYTTAMCLGGKSIEKRFSNIQNPKPRRRITAAIGTVLILMLFTTCVFASGAVQTAVYNDNRIEVLKAGEPLALKHTPFIDNEEVYVPVREVMSLYGGVEYQNGIITLTLSVPGGSTARAAFEVGKNDIYIELAKDSEMWNYGTMTTTHPALLKGDTAYMPLGMLIRLNHFRLYENDSAYRSVTLDPEWLSDLEIRKFGTDGKFDRMLSAKIDVTGENRYSPENYYEENENVIVATAEGLDNSDVFRFKEVNAYYFPVNRAKTIVVDDNNRVRCVIPYENQRHEALEPSWGGGTEFKLAIGQAGLNYAGAEKKKTPTIVYVQDGVFGKGGRLVGCYYLSPKLWVE